MVVNANRTPLQLREPAIVAPTLSSHAKLVKPRFLLEFLAVGGYLLALILILLQCAAVKLFWFDELFTLHLARQPGSLLTNLADGADNNPPLSYWLTSLAITIFGTSEWALRLPSVASAPLSCVCVYLFVRHRRGTWEAFLAMAGITLVAPVWTYFVEARPYGLLVAFSALSLLAWQRRWWWCFLLSMTAGMLTHYYFVVPVVALFVAESVQVWQSRKWDRGILAGFLAVGVVLAATCPLWSHTRQTYQRGFWAKVKWNRASVENTFHEFYRKELTLPVMIAMGMTCLLRRKDETEGYPFPEAVAVVGLACGPVLGVALGAKLVGAFYYRYILASILGFAVLFAYLIGRTSGGHRLGLCIASGGFVYFGLVGNPGLAVGYYRQDAKEHEDTANFLAEHTNAPIIVESSFDFSRIWHYRGRDVPVRFVADPALAFQHTKADTVDRGILALSRMTEVPVWSFEEVERRTITGEKLYFFGTATGWQAKEFERRKWSLTAVATHPKGTLYHLHRGE